MGAPALDIEIQSEAQPQAQPRRLRSLGRIIQWPHVPKPLPDSDGLGTGLLAKAEIRTKRFIDHRRVEEERYNAEVVSADSSLSGVMRALTQAFAEVEEFSAQRPAGEPIVMEIRLRA